MATKADSILICVFVGKSYTRLFNYDSAGQFDGINLGELSEEEYDAFAKAEAARDEIWKDFPKAKVTVNLCPYDLDNNIVIINQQKFGQNLPAILITGYYEGMTTQRVYPMPNPGLGGTGTYKAQDIYNRIRALYEGDFGTGEPSILCKFLPILCEIDIYVWAAAFGVAAYKTVEQKNNPALQTLWAAGAILAGESFIKAGGIKALTRKRLS